jgi:hypothetical protein
LIAGNLKRNKSLDSQSVTASLFDVGIDSTGIKEGSDMEKDLDRLYYACEVSEVGGEMIVVRFSSAVNRRHWVKGKTRRSVIPQGSPIISKLAEEGTTWEYVDGVSYANRPS